MQIEEFNRMDAAACRALVLVWAPIPAWADAVVDARPYPSVGALASEATTLAEKWTRIDLDRAIAHHPRIGEKPSGSGAEAEASRREQSSMTDADDGVAAQIAAGNAVYEAQFGRVFLIRAAGRSPVEMLAELDRRLGNSDADEANEAIRQLAEIALLRLRGALSVRETESLEAPS